jgi:putative ABC transport system permease protein
VFNIPEVQRQAHLLRTPDTALIDTRSRDFYGELTAGGTAELTRNTIKIVGTFPLGPDFRVDGNILISDQTFKKCIAGDLEQVEFGLIRVAAGHDVRVVQQDLVNALNVEGSVKDVDVLTRAELAGRVKNYWANSKPVGYVFGMGTFVGFLIGVTICYQILYTDIVDHLPQYATLKAIGYSNGYLVKIVLQQAVYLGVIGFFPGLLASLGIYAALESYSGILMRLTPLRAGIIFALTVVMCVVSGLIAIRKVISSDPAEVF